MALSFTGDQSRQAAAALLRLQSLHATRKLVKAGLIETEGSSSRKETCYRTTKMSRSVTEAYADLRAATLPPMLEALDGWAENRNPQAAILSWWRASMPRRRKLRSRDDISLSGHAYAARREELRFGTWLAAPRNIRTFSPSPMRSTSRPRSTGSC